MSNPERDLRDALGARARTVPVGRADETGLSRRLAAAERRRRAKVGSGAVALLVAVAAVSVVASADGDGQNVVAGLDLSSTTTAPEPSTTTPGVEASTTVLAPPLTSAATPSSAPNPAAVTTSVPRTTTTARPIPPVPDDALWPPPGSATTFRTPERATADFASRFLGIGSPEPGPARVSGDDATVEVRAMVVTLRRIGSRGWVVVGCAAPTIVVDQPTAGAIVESPLTVRGRSSTWEGHVDVEVRRDGSTAPIGRSFGTGGGFDSHRPFEATVTFTRPSEPRGTVILRESSEADHIVGPVAATVVRISF